MSMIQIIAHREEDVPIGFDFARSLPRGAQVTGLHSIRIERPDRTEVTDQILDLEAGGLPQHEIEGAVIWVRKRPVEPDDTDQPPGPYYVYIAATTDADARPMVLDIDGRVPVLVITDGR